MLLVSVWPRRGRREKVALRERERLGLRLTAGGKRLSLLVDLELAGQQGQLLLESGVPRLK